MFSLLFPFSIPAFFACCCCFFWKAIKVHRAMIFLAFVVCFSGRSLCLHYSFLFVSFHFVQFSFGLYQESSSVSDLISSLFFVIVTSDCIHCDTGLLWRIRFTRAARADSFPGSKTGQNLRRNPRSRTSTIPQDKAYCALVTIMMICIAKNLIVANCLLYILNNSPRSRRLQPQIIGKH